jgi:oxygen-independent coproporphyrinogen-3 oxidase
MAGVYISFPFCSQKCTFCNFASGVLPKALEDRYLAVLESEIQSHEWQWPVETVYLGGGTPSQIGPAALERLLSLLPRPAGGWREATIEAAPGSLSEDRVAAWVRSGINRVSLGVQSFVAQELARTGRRHRAETVEADVGLLARHGIRNVNIDLIAGLPGQTMESWRESLGWIERMGVPHVSVYMLEVDEDSRLGKEILAGGLRYGAGDAPPEELTVEFYENAVDRLAGLGIPRYEISNFARPGFESAHNLKYWRMEPYAGFGADAHSFDGVTRRQNVESVEEYVQGAARPQATLARLEEERLFTGLRLSAGVGLRDADRERYGEAIRRRIQDGLLEDRDGVLRLTRRGVLFSNEVFAEFVTA